MIVAEVSLALAALDYFTVSSNISYMPNYFHV